MKRIEQIEAEYLKKDLPEFKPGDTVRVSERIPEGDKFRIHDFEGVVIRRRGKGIKTSFTMRKISFGEGVERIFQLHSPVIDKLRGVNKGKTKRKNLFYLRGRVGKQAIKVKAETKEEKAK